MSLQTKTGRRKPVVSPSGFVCIFLSSYFPSISFNSSSTAAFNCVSSPFTTVSGELATLISGSNCEFPDNFHPASDSR